MYSLNKSKNPLLYWRRPGLRPNPQATGGPRQQIHPVNDIQPASATAPSYRLDRPWCVYLAFIMSRLPIPCALLLIGSFWKPLQLLITLGNDSCLFRIELFIFLVLFHIAHTLPLRYWTIVDTVWTALLRSCYAHWTTEAASRSWSAKVFPTFTPLCFAFWVMPSV